jgi:DNA polymerase I
VTSSLSGPNTPSGSGEDEWLFGWDSLPKITSVWANRDGLALVWRREGEQVICTRDRYRP